MERREALKDITLGLGILGALPLLAQTTKKIKVVVCGGGFGGLTTAKYLKKFNPNIDVTLIEKNKEFISCPYSNVWLGGIDNLTLKDFTFDYTQASKKYGYRFINEYITNIDRAKQKVITKQNEYEYDYLVLSPGISYDYSKIIKDTTKAKKTSELYPAAMIAGEEHLVLKKKIENFQGGTFVLNVPSETYRCPPAPYERACMIAYYFKQNNIKGKVVLIDPREKPAAKPKGFLSSFKDLYKDYIEYLPMTEIKDINLEEQYLKIDQFDMSTADYVSKELYFKDANIIPNMKPANLITQAGLELTKKGWTKLKAPTFETIIDSKVFVLGDASGYPFPKSGHMANSSGYYVARDIVSRIAKNNINLLDELPSNVCYSMVNGDPKEGIAVFHTVSFDQNKNKFNVKAKSSKKRDKETGDVIAQWYHGITSDIL